MITGQIAGRIACPAEGVVATMTVPPVESEYKVLPRILWVATALVLIVAVFPLPYGYYTFTRIVTCLACIVLAWSAWRPVGRSAPWAAIFTLLAILFNPIIPVHLTKKIWVVLDLGAAMIILAHLALVRGTQNHQAS
jgi:hypothetical protein